MESRSRAILESDNRARVWGLGIIGAAADGSIRNQSEAGKGTTVFLKKRFPNGRADQETDPPNRHCLEPGKSTGRSSELQHQIGVAERWKSGRGKRNSCG